MASKSSNMHLVLNQGIDRRSERSTEHRTKRRSVRWTHHKFDCRTDGSIYGHICDHIWPFMPIYGYIWACTWSYIPHVRQYMDIWPSMAMYCQTTSLPTRMLRTDIGRPCIGRYCIGGTHLPTIHRLMIAVSADNTWVDDEWPSSISLDTIWNVDISIDNVLADYRSAYKLLYQLMSCIIRWYVDPS